MIRKLLIAMAALLTLIAFDHGMRKMQLAECKFDTMPCPEHMWLLDQLNASGRS